MNEKLRMMELRMMGMNQKHHESVRLIMAALEDFQPSGLSQPVESCGEVRGKCIVSGKCMIYRSDVLAELFGLSL